MHNIAITGATSFIGLNLVRMLLKKDYVLYLVVRPNSDKLQLLPMSSKINLIELDFKDYGKLSSLIDVPIKYFFHLTWNGTRGSERSNQKLQNLNYEYSLDVLEAANKLKTETFFSAGSQAEYGHQQHIITETTVPKPSTYYGVNKIKFFEYAMRFSRNNGMHFKEPRFFSLYGPDDDKNTLIISTLLKMLENRLCDFTDCKQSWNFLYVEDAVRAMLWLAEHDCEDGAYNFAAGDTRELKEFIMELAKITQTKSKLNFGALPHNDTGTFGIQPDISKLLATGWQPEVSFGEGISNIIKNLK